MNKLKKKSDIYVLSDSVLIKKIRSKILRKFPTLKSFAQVHEIKHKTLYSWFETGSRIPIWFVSSILGNDIYSYLEGYFLVSGSSNYKLRVRTKIGMEEASLLGWVLSEGHLGEFKCTISQSERRILEKIKESCEKYYGNCGAKIYPDKEIFKLALPVVFVTYFNERYGVPRGKKSSLIRIPSQIMNGSDEIKHAFLASYIEGDGSFSYYSTKYIKRPRINITTYSPKFAEDCTFLFQSLNYRAKIYKSKKEHKIALHRSDDISTFYQKAKELLLDEEKKRRFKSYLSQSYFLKTISVDGKQVTNDFKIKVGNWKQASQTLKRLGYNASHYTIKNWKLGYFKTNLKAVLLMANYLGSNPSKYVPKEYQGVLELHGEKLL